MVVSFLGGVTAEIGSVYQLPLADGNWWLGNALFTSGDSVEAHSGNETLVLSAGPP